MRKVILDTDIGPDCDDAAALGLAHLYHKKGMIDLLAVVHCTSNPWGGGAIAAINSWYKHPVAIGTLAEEGFLSGEETLKYNRDLAKTIEPGSFETFEAVSLYRRILAAADDQSIDIVAIGPLKNLGNLLRSGPDAFSEDDGRILVARKVARLITMAGRFDHVNEADCEQQAEWNVMMDIPAARLVFETWPGTIICSGYELGAAILTGEYFCQYLGDDHPVKRAYLMYTGGLNRPSWDLTAVQFAAEEDTSDYELSPAGLIELGVDGVTYWAPVLNGCHHYMIARTSTEEIAHKLDLMLCETNV